MNQSSGKLESPMLFNLTRDPKEETNVAAVNTWVKQPMLRMKAAFATRACAIAPPPEPKLAPPAGSLMAKASQMNGSVTA